MTVPESTPLEESASEVEQSFTSAKANGHAILVIAHASSLRDANDFDTERIANLEQSTS